MQGMVCGAARFFCLFTLCAAMLLPACAFRDEADDVQEGMRIRVDLREEHRCSRMSPAIYVSDAPEGTAYYDVRLVEIQSEAQEVFLGGGAWEHDGTGLIPEGVLTRHYRGPCPASGRTGNYAFVVSAMSRKSMQPLAVRLYRFTQE